MSEINRRLKVGGYMSLAVLGQSIALTLALGYSWVGFGKIWIAISMNLFALPLGVLGVFEWPFWVWYVIGATWLGDVYFYKKYLWEQEQ